MKQKKLARTFMMTLKIEKNPLMSWFRHGRWTIIKTILVEGPVVVRNCDRPKLMSGEHRRRRADVKTASA